jgi:hypothetical protein
VTRKFSTVRILTETVTAFGTSKGLLLTGRPRICAGGGPFAIGPRSLSRRVFVLPSKAKPLPAHFAISYESCAPHSHWYGWLVL